MHRLDSSESVSLWIPWRRMVAVPLHADADREVPRRLSGPLRDRIDLIVDVAAVPVHAIADTAPGEATAVVRERVCAARSAQQARHGASDARTNADLRGSAVARFCGPDAKGHAVLRTAIERFGLSARGYDRVLKVARTIADLAGSDGVSAPSTSRRRCNTD